MKRIIPSVLVANFPYMILFYLCWVLDWAPVSFPKDWTIFELYGCVILTWLAGLIGAIWIAVSNADAKTDVEAAAKNNMLIKVIQIPAYVVLFIAGALFSTIVFTWLITFTIIVTDVMAILLSGINGAVVAGKCRKAGLLQTGSAVWYGISQFIYCADVICAATLYCKTMGLKLSVTFEKAGESPDTEEESK